MRIDPETGVLDGVRWVDSPNQDARPAGVEVELVVVHGISLPPGEFGGGWIEDLFTNALDPGVHPYFATIAGLRVSAHVLVRRRGEVTQYVPFQRRAWHAGKSSYRGRADVNDFSVGIELEGADEVPYTVAQYRRLARLLRALFAAYPALTADRVVGHSEVAPGRKTDPGPAFDWGRLRSLLPSGFDPSSRW
jgi:N-acetyl-anhydromuramoyl-L-alanine amidase